MCRKVVYILAQIDRIGQLAGEMFYLRNLYPQTENEITVITYPPEFVPRTNLATYNIATRGVKVLHSIDDRLVWYTHHNRGENRLHLSPEENCLFYLFHPEHIGPAFMQARRSGDVIHPFQLSEEEVQRGGELKKRFDIPDTAPIVSMHVREGGYLPNLSYHSYRDSNVVNYLPAIHYLIEQGYYVVRLGDRSMQRFENPPEQLIDSPFHPAYEDLVEPYFISQSKFYISTGSGPHSIAKGFGIPVLLTNLPVLVDAWGEPDDLVIHKNYYSKKLRRFLSYEEILTSPALEYFYSNHYKEAGLELHENSPDEIFVAVKEMTERLEGKYPRTDVLAMNQRVQALRKKVHERRRITSKDTVYPFLPTYWHELQISCEFLLANPHFMP